MSQSGGSRSGSHRNSRADEDPELSVLQRQERLKEVRVYRDDLMKNQPVYSKPAEVLLERRAQISLHTPVREGDRWIYTIPDHITANEVNATRYRISSESLLSGSDVNARLAALATLYNVDGFRFAPLTHAGKAAFRDDEGVVVDQTMFEDMAHENSTALFHEMRVRALLVQAHREQITHLQRICRGFDTDVTLLIERISDLGDEVDVANEAVNEATVIGNDSKTVKEQAAKIEILQKQADQYQAELEDSREDLSHVNRKLRRFEQAREQLTSAQPIDNPNPISTARARQDTPGARSNATGTSQASNMTRQGAAARNAATMSTRRADNDPGEDPDSSDREQSAVRGSHRSQKAADAPYFYADKDKDTVSFEVFFRQLSNKLEANADYYPTDIAERVYIESRLQGAAASDLQPYLRKGHPDQIQTAEQLLDHLWNEYYDPNVRDKAAKDFADLEMKADMTYKEFRNKFVRLAGECGIPRNDYKREFHRRVLPSISRALAAQYIDDEYSFNRYAEVGAQIDLTYQMSKKREKKVDEAGTSSRKGKKGKFSKDDAKDSDGKGTTSSNNNSNRLSREERAKLRDEGKCFICKETDHISPNCPKRAAGREGRIQAAEAGADAPASNREKLNSPTTCDSEN